MAVVEVKPPFVFVDDSPIPVDLEPLDLTRPEIVPDGLPAEAGNL